MSSEASPSLEFILFEMLVRSHYGVTGGFADTLLRAVEKLGGVLLFNLKLEDDDPYQRCAAVLLGQKEQDECVVLAFLSKDGRRVTIENAANSSHPLAAKALQDRIQVSDEGIQTDAAFPLQERFPE